MASILGQFGNHGLPLGRIAGIRVTLDWTWFLIAFLFLLSFTGAFAGAGMGFGLALLGGLLCAAGFFGSILAHEFGHALTARRFGIRTESIALHVFGGVARLLGEPRTPHQELLISAAGPAVSIGLGGLFWLLGAAVPDAVPGLLAMLGAVFAYLGWANLVLGLFNLLPGFPLDGGRMLRAVLWARKRSWAEGTRVAARAGEGVGYGLMGLGALALLARGDLGTAIMLGAVGFLILQAARMEGLRALSQGRTTSFDIPHPASWHRTAAPGARPFGAGPQRRPREQVIRLPDGQIVVVREPPDRAPWGV